MLEWCCNRRMQDVLQLTGCWTSKTEFIKGGDLKAFLPLQKKQLKDREELGRLTCTL